MGLLKGLGMCAFMAVVAGAILLVSRGNLPLQVPRKKYNSYERQLASSLIDPDEIEDTFDSIGGLEEQKRLVLEQVVWPFNHPEVMRGLSPASGVLLHGAPGTGKTMIARAIAKETHANFIEVKVESLLCKYVGESEKLASALFTLARKVQPAILFIDEIDTFLTHEGGGGGHQVQEHARQIFLRNWSGMGGNLADERIIIIGATNRPGNIDDAVLRRMSVKIEFSYPTCEERSGILRTVMRKYPNSLGDSDYAAVAAATQLYSGHDLAEVAKEGRMTCIREVMAKSSRSTSRRESPAPTSFLSKWGLRSPPPPQEPGRSREIRPVTRRDLLRAMGVVGANQRFVSLHRGGGETTWVPSPPSHHRPPPDLD